MSHIQLRIDPEEKDKAQQVLSAMGLSLSGAIKLFLREVVKQKRLPFEVTADETQLKPKRMKKPVMAKIPKPETVEELGAPTVKTWNPFQQRRIGQ